MGRQVNVITADLDGAQLRREKNKNSLHVRCKGKHDEHDINDAYRTADKDSAFFMNMSEEAWERIFGGKEGV